MNATQLARFKSCINGNETIVTDINLNYPGTLANYKAGEGNTGIYPVRIIPKALQACVEGYLIYTNDYCVVIGYNGSSQKMFIADINATTGNTTDRSQFLTIEELRRTLDDVSEEEGAKEFKTLECETLYASDEIELGTSADFGTNAKAAIRNAAGGTTVVANPSPEGSTPLTGLQVGNDKYVINCSKKYIHRVLFSCRSDYYSNEIQNITCEIITSDATPYESFYAFQNAAGASGYADVYIPIGTVAVRKTTAATTMVSLLSAIEVYTTSYSASRIYVIYQDISFADTTNILIDKAFSGQRFTTTAQVYAFEDKVIEL